MIRGIGVDVTRISRIRSVCQRFPTRFAERILSADELRDFSALSASRADAFMAKRFAAKEAAAKALGTAIRDGVAMKDFCVQRGEHGRPLLSVSGRALDKARGLGISNWHLSITDEEDTVVAFVVAEGDA